MALWFEMTLLCCGRMDLLLIYIHLPILTMCMKDVGFEKHLKSKSGLHYMRLYILCTHRDKKKLNRFFFLMYFC